MLLSCLPVCSLLYKCTACLSVCFLPWHVFCLLPSLAIWLFVVLPSCPHLLSFPASAGLPVLATSLSAFRLTCLKVCCPVTCPYVAGLLFVDFWAATLFQRYVAVLPTCPFAAVHVYRCLSVHFILLTCLLFAAQISWQTFCWSAFLSLSAVLATSLSAYFCSDYIFVRCYLAYLSECYCVTYLSVCFNIFHLTCLSVCLLSWLPVSLLATWSTCYSVCFPAYLAVWLLCLPVCMLLNCMSVCLPLLPVCLLSWVSAVLLDCLSAILSSIHCNLLYGPFAHFGQYD